MQVGPRQGSFAKVELDGLESALLTLRSSAARTATALSKRSRTMLVGVVFR